MWTVADDASLVVDLEGFQVQHNFAVREMGWCTWQGMKSGSIHYLAVIIISVLKISVKSASFVIIFMDYPTNLLVVLTMNMINSNKM